MNSLEFIDREIELLKQCLMINKTHDTLNYKLKYLQQIKAELEAWYAVKSGLIYEKERKHRMSEEMRCAYTIYLTDDGMESIQKALEINEK